LDSEFFELEGGLIDGKSFSDGAEIEADSGSFESYLVTLAVPFDVFPAAGYAGLLPLHFGGLVFASAESGQGTE
jgi:hypothetical protein